MQPKQNPVEPADLAVESAYREVGPFLLAYFQRRHGNPQTAQDLLQETFAAVLRSPDRWRQAQSPRAYLFGVARNLSADFFRRCHPAEELPPESPAAEPSLSDPRLEQMRAAIGQLNAASRQVLELRLQRELSYEAMAEFLRVPVGTVRSRLHHAVRQLREHMQRQIYE